MEAEKLENLKLVVSKLLEDIGVAHDDAIGVIEDLEKYTIENGRVLEDRNLNEGVFISEKNWIEKTKMNIGSPSESAVERGLSFRPIFDENGQISKVTISSLIRKSENTYISKAIIGNGFSVPGVLGITKDGFVSPIYNGANINGGNSFSNFYSSTIVNSISKEIENNVNNSFNSTVLSSYARQPILNKKNSLSSSNVSRRSRLFEGNKAVTNVASFDTFSAPDRGIFDLEYFGINYNNKNYGLFQSLDKNQSVKTRFSEDVVNNFINGRNFMHNGVLNRDAVYNAIGDAFLNRSFEQIDTVFSNGRASSITDFDSFERVFREVSDSRHNPLIFSVNEERILNSARRHFDTTGSARGLREFLRSDLGFDSMRNSYIELLKTNKITSVGDAKLFARNILNDINFGFHAGIISGLKGLGFNNGSYQKIYDSFDRGFESSRKNYARLYFGDFRFNLTDLTLDNFDVNLSFAKKTPGLFLLEELQKSGRNKNQILKTFGVVNSLISSTEPISQRQYNAVRNLFGAGNGHLFDLAFNTKNTLTLTALAQKDKAVISGKSTTIGSGILGDLTFMNKTDVRSWQKMDILTDYVKRQRDGSLVNVTEKLVQNKLKIKPNAPVIDNKLFVNENLGLFDKMNRYILEGHNPRRYSGYSSMSSNTRGNVNVLALDIYNVKEGSLFTFNESAIMNRDVSDVLVAAKDRKGYTTDHDILKNLSKEEASSFTAMNREQKLAFISKQMKTENLGKGVRYHKNDYLLKIEQLLDKLALERPDDFSRISEKVSNSQTTFFKKRLEKLNSINEFVDEFFSSKGGADDFSSKVLKKLSNKNGKLDNSSYNSFRSFADSVFELGNDDLSSQYKLLKQERAAAKKEYVNFFGGRNSKKIIKAIKEKIMYTPEGAELDNLNIMLEESERIHNRNLKSKTDFVEGTSQLIYKYAKNGGRKELKRKINILTDDLSNYLNSDAKTKKVILQEFLKKPKAYGINADDFEEFNNFYKGYDELAKEFSKEIKIKRVGSKDSIFRKAIKYDYSYSFDEFNEFANKDSIDFKNLRFGGVSFDEANNRYVFDFNEVHKASVGSKFHFGSGEKFTSSYIAKKLSVGELNVGVASSSKSFARGFSGSDVMSFIKTSLYFAENKAKYLDSIKYITDDLGLQITQAGDSFHFFDTNAGLDKNLSIEHLVNSLRNTIDNPYLNSYLSSNETYKRLQKYKGIEDIISKLNEHYKVEGVGGKQQLFGDFDLNVNGVIHRVNGMLKLDAIGISGSHGKGPMKNALKMDAFAARFIGSKGYHQLENMLFEVGNKQLGDFIARTTALPTNLINGSYNSKEFANLVATYKTTLNASQKTFFDFNTEVADNIYNEIQQRGSSLNFDEFVGILRNNSGFGDNAIDSFINQKGIKTFSYDYSGDSFSYLKNAMAEEIEATGLMKKGEDFHEALKDYKNFVNDKNGHYDSEDYKNIYRTLRKAANSADDENKLIYKIVSSINGKTDKASVFKMLQLLEDTHNSVTIGSAYNAFYKNGGNVGINEFVKKLENAKDMEKFALFDRISKGLDGGLVRNNDPFMRQMDSYSNKISQNSMFDNFDKAFFKTLKSSVSKSNSSLAVSLDQAFEGYYYARRNSNASIDVIARRANELMNVYQDVASYVKNNNVTFGENHLEKQSKAFLKSSIFNIFSGSNYEADRLTRKHSVYGRLKSVGLKASISGKPSEGTLFTEMLGKMYEDSKNRAGFIDDMKEFFGEKVFTEFFADGIDLSKNSVEDIQKFKGNLRKLENFSIVSRQSLMHNGGKQSLNFFEGSLVGRGINGFFGFLSRHPHQSEAHFAPALTFFADAEKAKTNSIHGLLNDLGLHTSNNGMMVIGKKTALGMFADFDGDIFYLADFREFIEKNSKGGYSIDDYRTQSTAEIFALRGLEGEELINRTAGFLGVSPDSLKSKHLRFFDDITGYAKTYRDSMKHKLNYNLNKHLDSRQLIFSSDVMLENVATMIKDGKTNSEIANSVLDNLGDNFAETIERLGGREGVVKSISEVLDSGVINRNLINNYLGSTIDMAGIMYTGSVWYDMNTRRNLGQIISESNTSVDALQGYFRSELAKKANTTVAALSEQTIADGLGSVLVKSGYENWNELSSKFDSFVKGVQTNRHEFDKIYAESIESGVISAKHNGKYFFQSINDATKFSLNEGGFSDSIAKIDSLIKSSSIDDINDFFDLINKESTTEHSLINQIFSNLNDEKHFGSSHTKGKITSGNLENAVEKLRKTKVILSVNDSYAGIENILSLNDERRPFLDKFNNLVKKFGIDINWNSKQGRGKTAAELAYEAESFSVSNSQLDTRERIINNSSRKPILDEAEIRRTAEENIISNALDNGEYRTDDKVARAIVELDDFAEDVSRVADDAKAAAGRFDSLGQYAKGNKGKFGLLVTGLVALGGFIGYNAHRNTISSYDEEKEGYLGAVPGVTDFRQQNNLGYINYNKKRER